MIIIYLARMVAKIRALESQNKKLTKFDICCFLTPYFDQDDACRMVSRFHSYLSIGLMVIAYKLAKKLFAGRQTISQVLDRSSLFP